MSTGFRHLHVQYIGKYSLIERMAGEVKPLEGDEQGKEKGGCKGNKEKKKDEKLRK